MVCAMGSGNTASKEASLALSEDQIIDLFNEACRETFNGLERFRYFARAIEAEVRASHAQTPAENEHVPAVVSANRAESNMTGAVPLTREQVKAICVESGYETATLQERADFINGIRHAERHHGIKGKTK